MKTEPKEKSKRKPAGRTRALAVDAGWAPVSSWPKINSAKLTSENRVYIHPICGMADGKNECLKGWKILGWGNAPWASGLGPHAIVYEKTSAAGSESIYASSHADWEPGIYWGHGDAKTMLFQPNAGGVPRPESALMPKHSTPEKL